MATLVSALEWNYVATINEEGMLGGVESFIRNARAKSKSLQSIESEKSKALGNIFQSFSKKSASLAPTRSRKPHQRKMSAIF